MSSRHLQPQAPAYSSRSSTSSDSSSSASYYGDSYTSRSSIDSSSRQSTPRVETLRCSRCAKCVETVVSTRSNGEPRRVSTDDISASGMVRFGHNLYYCERCARMSDTREGIWTTQVSQDWHKPIGEIGNRTGVLSPPRRNSMGFAATTKRATTI